jgi:hypothetical protein
MAPQSTVFALGLPEVCLQMRTATQQVMGGRANEAMFGKGRSIGADGGLDLRLIDIEVRVYVLHVVVFLKGLD